MSAAIPTLLALICMAGLIMSLVLGEIYRRPNGSMSLGFTVSSFVLLVMAVFMSIWARYLPRPPAWSPRFEGDDAVVEIRGENDIDILRRKMQVPAGGDLVPEQRPFSEESGASCAIQLRSGDTSILITVPSGPGAESMLVVSLSGDGLRYGHVGMAVDDGQVCIQIAKEGE